MSAVRRWLAEPLPRAVAQALEGLAAARGVRRVAVMPDVHLAEHVCVGTVLGTEGWIYPQAVGGDIGCGMAAVRLRGDLDSLDARAAEQLFGALRDRVPAMRTRRARADALGELSDPVLQRRVARDASVQLGTLGRGNHFLELQADEHGGAWLMVHSGSRAVGPAVRDHHVRRGAKKGEARLVALAADAEGLDYLRDAEVAADYARRNRKAIAQAAEWALRETLGVEIDWPAWFDVTHNFVRRERHAGLELWVHRKGANSAHAGDPGIIPGSMGTLSFHVAGRGCDASMCSSSHGAGRRLSRGDALRAISARKLEREMKDVFFERHLMSRLRDEAPAAYKDIGAVMRAQKELVRVVRRLRPLLAYKGG